MTGFGAASVARARGGGGSTGWEKEPPVAHKWRRVVCPASDGQATLDVGAGEAGAGGILLLEAAGKPVGDVLASAMVGRAAGVAQDVGEIRGAA